MIQEKNIVVEPTGAPAMRQIKIATKNRITEVYKTERIISVPNDLTKEEQLNDYIIENQLHSRWYLHPELVSETQTYFIDETDETFEIING